MKENPILTVFISGSGSNLAAIIAAIASGKLKAQIGRVIADRDCAGKAHAFAAHIPFIMVDRKLPEATFKQQLHAAISPETRLIVLAGFLSVIPLEIIQAYPQKIINLHPSLLPKYGGKGMYGMRVHQAVLSAGETSSGCSVHYVDEGIDTGKVIAQKRVPVYQDDTPQVLQQRIQKQEHTLLVDTIAMLLN